MQCGQIERIWFEDELFPAYHYRQAPVDGTNLPAQALSSSIWGESPRSLTQVYDRSAISSAPLHSRTDLYEAAVTH